MPRESSWAGAVSSPGLQARRTIQTVTGLSVFEEAAGEHDCRRPLPVSERSPLAQPRGTRALESVEGVLSIGSCAEGLGDHLPTQLSDERLTARDHLRDGLSAMHDGVALADRARQQPPEACIELLYVGSHRTPARHPSRRLGDHPVLHRRLVKSAEYLCDALHERPRLERERQVAA